MKDLAHTPYQFALARILTGTFLAIYFTIFVLMDVQMASEAIVLPPTHFHFHPFWELLSLFSSSAWTTVVICAAILLSLLLLLGVLRRPVALLLALIWLSIPHTIGLFFVVAFAAMILAFAMFPLGEP